MSMPATGDLNMVDDAANVRLAVTGSIAHFPGPDSWTDEE